MVAGNDSTLGGKTIINGLMKKAVVLGFGFMGMTHTLNILKNVNLELVAIIDKYPDTIAKSLSSPGGNFTTGHIDPEILKNIRIYHDFDECLRSEEFDAVFICVHTDLHYEMARKALVHNKHVFLEKPFTLDIQQGEELINLARQNGKILMIAHVVRFMPPYQQLKQWIDSNKYGRLKFLSLSRFSGAPAWGQWKEKQLNFGLSGGALFDLTIHDIDFVNYVLGQPGSIKCHYLPGAFSNHDYISALWNYPERDLNVKIEGGNTFHPSFPFQAGFMARFENASVQYTTFKNDTIQIATDTSLDEVPAGDAGEGFLFECDYFARCINDGNQPVACMPESSLETIRLCYDHLKIKVDSLQELQTV